MSKFITSILGDISEYITSGSRDWSKYYSDTGALFVRTQDINKNQLDISSSARVALPDKVEGKRTRLQKGDLLVTITGANVGKCAVVDWDIEEAYVSQSVALIRLKCPDSAKFVYHQLTCKEGDQTYLEKAAYGLGRPVLNLTNMREVPIVLTSPEVQKEIVSEIEKQFSRLDEAVASLKRIQANLKRYKAAVLKAAMEGKLTEQWRKDHPDVEPADQLLKRILTERRTKWEAEELAKIKAKGIKPKDDSWKKKYKEPAGPDMANLPGLPEGWVWASLEQVGLVTTGFTPPTGNPNYFGGDIPFFKPTDLDAGYCTSQPREWLTALGAERGRLLPAKSVLVTCIGATIGKTGLTRVKCATNQQINTLTVTEEFVLPEFMYWFFVSPEGQKQIIENSSATTLPILNKSKFEALGAAVPPLVEQCQIVAEIDRRLSVTEELEVTIETNLKRAERLRQTILQKAFLGGVV